MKKLFTLLALLCVIAGGIGQVAAQVQPRSLSIKTNLNSVRFLVNTPASLNGLKKATIAPWGGQASPPLLNAPVARGLDSLAALPLTNAAAVNGKVCLLFRGGGVTFAQKAQYAVAAGATGVIIVNNVSGDPVGMANTGTVTYTVPIVMISNTDGLALNSAILSGSAVTVSIGSWNLAATHDLGILGSYQSGPHALNIPFSQLSAGANRQPYKNFVGGAILNFGSAAETNITVSDTVTWTPTGGAATTVHTDNYNVASIPASDTSIRFGFGSNSSSYSLPAPTSTGIYTYNYRLSYANTDQIPQDNTYSYDQYVTDSIFCKGKYDYAKGAPSVSLGIQPAGATSAYSFGPLYYVARGKYAARKIQFSVSKNGVPTLENEEAYALLYKWVDGSNAQPLDSIVEGDELKLVGISSKTFTTADSSGATVTVPVRDPVSATRTVILDSNAWYWTAAQATSNCFIGVDASYSPFTRSYIQSQLFGYQELPELLFTQDYINLAGSSDALAAFPFARSPLDIDSTFYDAFNEVPAVALHISKNQVTPTSVIGAGNPANAVIGVLKAYPSPADADITVEISLAKASANVRYRLLDIAGKVVYKADRSQLQNDRFVIPASSLNSGIYHVLVMTEDGLISQQVTIKH